MNWSVHQYQKPMTMEAMITPGHGNSGSAADLIRCMLGPAMAWTSAQPPTFTSPITRMTIEPISSTGDWSTEV